MASKSLKLKALKSIIKSGSNKSRLSSFTSLKSKKGVLSAMFKNKTPSSSKSMKLKEVVSKVKKSKQFS